MNKPNNLQQGFTLVEALLILLVVSIISFGGYYVWHSQNSDDNAKTSGKTEVASTDNKETKEAAKPATKEEQLETYLVDTCSSSDAAAIHAMFKNQASQTIDSDSVKLSGNYAIANVNCTLDDGTQLVSLYAKYDSSWDLVVKKAVGISCDYLTNEGFPNDLKAPYCSNSEFNPS